MSVQTASVISLIYLLNLIVVFQEMNCLDDSQNQCFWAQSMKFPVLTLGLLFSLSTDRKYSGEEMILFIYQIVFIVI